MGKWLVAALLLVIIAVQVEATFASSTGFSGRNVDCTICHAPGAPAAFAHLEGAPATWRPGVTYALDAGVSGGVLALPSPQPQGGFEFEVEAGTVGGGTGMDGLLRFPRPTVATYEPEGTLRRAWSLTWTAPAVHEPPGDVTLWLAVMAANGNHVIATNTTDGGEQGDAVATLELRIPPAADVVTAWRALPLSAPVVDRIEQTAGGTRILGHHTDANTTELGYHVGDGAWRTAVTPLEFSLVVAGDVSLIELRSEGTGRVSPSISTGASTAQTSALGIVPIVSVLAALGWSGRRCTPREP